MIGAARTEITERRNAYAKQIIVEFPPSDRNRLFAVRPGNATVGRRHRVEMRSGRKPELISNQLQLISVDHVRRPAADARALLGRHRVRRLAPRIGPVAAWLILPHRAPKPDTVLSTARRFLAPTYDRASLQSCRACSTSARSRPTKGRTNCVRADRRSEKRPESVRYVSPAHGRRRRHGRRLQNKVQPPLGPHALADVPLLLANAPLLALPYWRSSQSDLAHVACTFARLVAATRASDIPAVVESQQAGPLVGSRDHDVLVAVIVALRRDPATASRLGAVGYAKPAAASRDTVTSGAARGLLSVGALA
jgi:hypothetical protein